MNNISANNSKLSAISDSPNHHKLKVIASFYPIYEFVEQVGRDIVEVSSLIPIGVATS